ncbi:MAG: Na(+)-translocating NADH-quinone reductase subunit C [Gammaproteobacteria bacterium]|jgi:Na+-transporting NADH:ubiquinone oxidoreductase subunit C
MPEANKQQARKQPGWFASLPNDSVLKTVTIATLLCLVCSVVVSATAVSLKPLQQRNAILAMKQEILRVAGLDDPDQSVEASFASIETLIIDLSTGQVAADIDPATFDLQKASRNPETSEAIPAGQDIASLGRRPLYAPVYVVREDGDPGMLIFPVSGYGLWSTMYGFLALEGDANTVAGLTFYQDAETPGLGAEINNPRWQRKWVGKRVFDADGGVALRVIKGAVNPGAADAEYQVDGISGATPTGTGVSRMIEFWMGEQGFGPFLQRVRDQEGEI